MIDVIALLGDDALQNLFDVIIPPFPGALDPGSTSLRVQGFNIPATGNAPYDVHYKTQMMTKPSGKVQMPNEFTFTFRIDKYWRVYNGFKNWKNIVLNTRLGTMVPDIGVGVAGAIRVPILVAPVDSFGVPTTVPWTFEGCYVQELGDVNFDYTSGDPIMVDVTMAFMVMNDVAPV